MFKRLSETVQVTRNLQKNSHERYVGVSHEVEVKHGQWMSENKENAETVDRDGDTNCADFQTMSATT